MEGLDKKQLEAAETFLEAEPELDFDPSFSSVITSRTRKKIETIAKPKAKKFNNPFIQIAESMDGFSFDKEDLFSDFSLRISLDKKSDVESNPTLGLFSFLFGNMLNELVDSSSNSEGVNFVIDQSLISQYTIPEINEDSDEDEKELRWLPLRLYIELLYLGDVDTDINSAEVVDTDGPIEWLPDSSELVYLAFYWFLVRSNTDSFNKILAIHNEHSFESSFRSIITGESNIKELLVFSALPDNIDGDIIDQAIDSKRDLYESMKESGLSLQALESYVDELHECYTKASETHIPNNKIEPVPATLINMDVIHEEGGKTSLMLLNHPLKSRWLARYFRETINLSLNALQGELSLNTENSDLYFDWINNLSPSQFPAISSNSQGNFLISTRMNGWFEYYATTEDTICLDRGTPKAIIDEIVKKVHQYLHHHPHKIDGISVTVVTRDDASIAAKLVKSIRSAEFAKVRMTLNLVTDSKVWSRAILEFEAVDNDNRFTMDGALFPEVELRLFELKNDKFTPDSELNELESDVLVIPHFLDDKNTYQERNKVYIPEISNESKFSPLYEEPVYIEPTTGNAIAVALLPDRNDRLSEAWSTMVTRHIRLSPVSSAAYSDAGGTDYYVKQIKFNENAQLLEFAHSIAHWVITIEQYLSREQIENLPGSPDIISFKSGVGPGGKYSLMVSSNKGKKFILQRLEKKLTKIFELASSEVSDIASIAQLIYEDTRQISPELALDALGVARVTEEILGLAVARRVLTKAHEVDVENGTSVIISLDNYKNWFSGGESALRADMLKLIFEMVDDSLQVYVYVLESKLRKEVTLDRHGEQQVLSTMRLIEQFIDPTKAEKNIDAKLWRHNVISAILNTSEKSFTQHGQMKADNTKLGQGIRDKFLKGNYKLSLLHGLFVQSSTSSNSEIEVFTSSHDIRLSIFEVGLKGIVETLSSDNGLGYLHDNAQIGLKSDPSDSNRSQSPNGSTDGKTSAGEQTTETLGEPGDLGGSEIEVQPDTTSDKNSLKTAVNITGNIPQEVLKEKYQEIMTILSHKHKLNVKALGWNKGPVIEGPSSFLYRFEYNGSNPSEIAQKHDSLKLDLKLQESQSIKYGIDAGYITIDVPKQEDERYFVNAESLWNSFSINHKELIVPLGIDRFGESVEINFSDSNSPHVLIGGTTGSGKSEALNTILTGLCKFYKPDELRLLLIDPKGTEMTLYEETELIHEEIAMYDDEALNLLDQAVEEMNSRYLLFRDTSKAKKTRIADLSSYNGQIGSQAKIPWWLIVIDEYADLTSDKDFKKKFEKQLMRIAQKGRAAGVHLILATQKPSGDVISTTLRSNLPSALALRVRDYHASRVILEENGAETLIGKGDAIFKRQGSIERIQCARVDNIEKALGL